MPSFTIFILAGIRRFVALVPMPLIPAVFLGTGICLVTYELVQWLTTGLWHVVRFSTFLSVFSIDVAVDRKLALPGVSLWIGSWPLWMMFLLVGGFSVTVFMSLSRDKRFLP